MAEGRMLKKAISTSRKLADLDTDSARLLYTWLIPFLDVEGRYFGEPDIIKGSIVPRIKDFTIEKVKECLVDIQRVKLILWYEVDGDKYLQFICFGKHQNINRDREAKSSIPSPLDQDITNITQENSGVTQENSCELLRTPLKLSKVNRREVNISIRENNLKKEDFLDLDSCFKKLTKENYIKLLSAKIQILDWNELLCRIYRDIKPSDMELIMQHLVLWVYNGKSKITNPLSTLKVIHSKIQMGELTIDVLDKTNLYEQIGEYYDPVHEKMKQEQKERELSQEYKDYVIQYKKDEKEAMEKAEEERKANPIIYNPEIKDLFHNLELKYNRGGEGSC